MLLTTTRKSPATSNATTTCKPLLRARHRRTGPPQNPKSAPNKNFSLKIPRKNPASPKVRTVLLSGARNNAPDVDDRCDHNILGSYLVPPRLAVPLLPSPARTCQSLPTPARTPHPHHTFFGKTNPFFARQTLPIAAKPCQPAPEQSHRQTQPRKPLGYAVTRYAIPPRCLTHTTS